MISHFKINSLRNKFDLLANQITRNVNVLVVSDTEPDASFPTDQFKIPSFSTPFWRDRSQYGGGLLVFLREEILAKHLSICPMKVPQLKVFLLN